MLLTSKLIAVFREMWSVYPWSFLFVEVCFVAQGMMNFLNVLCILKTNVYFLVFFVWRVLCISIKECFLIVFLKKKDAKKWGSSSWFARSCFLAVCSCGRQWLNKGGMAREKTREIERERVHSLVFPYRGTNFLIRASFS